mgnify:CR=1 FL=1
MRMGGGESVEGKDRHSNHLSPIKFLGISSMYYLRSLRALYTTRLHSVSLPLERCGVLLLLLLKRLETFNTREKGRGVIWNVWGGGILTIIFYLFFWGVG